MDDFFLNLNNFQVDPQASSWSFVERLNMMSSNQIFCLCSDRWQVKRKVELSPGVVHVRSSLWVQGENFLTSHLFQCRG